MRTRFSGLAVGFILAVFCAASAYGATTYHIRRDAAPGDPNTYRTLKDFQDAVDNDHNLVLTGATVILHNDDDTLTTLFEVPGYLTLNIEEGTAHFGEKFEWRGISPVNIGAVHVGKNGTFKPSITAGDLEDHLGSVGITPFNADKTWLRLDTFTSEEGARLEVGGISSMPFIGSSRVGNTISSYKVTYPIASVTNLNDGDVASTMHVNNRLMEAYLEIGDLDSGGKGLILRIERVENLSSIDGIGGYADVYRRMPGLSEAERDMLDAIYASGNIGAAQGFIQTIGGQIVQNSFLALRHNQANLISKINTRLTKYQKEELELTPEITGSDFLHHVEDDPITRYGELWAAIDQTWMTQRDVADMAGYRYNATGLSIGYDRHHDNIIYGGVLNYAGGSMKLRNLTATQTELDSFIAAAYGSWALDGWYVSGTLFAAYGWNESESAFSLAGLTSAVAKTGTYGTSSYGANVEFGYMMETDLVGIPLRVTPYGGLTYARMHRDAVRESGGGNFNRQFRAGVLSVWDATLGARVSVPMEGNGYMLVPSVDVAWTRTMGNPEASGGDAYFVSDPSAPWNIAFMDESRNSVRFAAALDARFRNNVTVGAGYELEWRNQFWKNQLNLMASVEF